MSPDAFRAKIDLNVKRFMRNANAHYIQSERVYRSNKKLTVLLLGLTIFSLAISSSGALDKILDGSIKTAFQIALIVLAAAAATGASIQYAFNHSQGSSEHKVAGAMFSELRKELEVLSLVNDDDIVWKLAEFQHIMSKSAMISRLAPIIPANVFDKFRNLDGDHAIRFEDT